MVANMIVAERRLTTCSHRTARELYGKQFLPQIMEVMQMPEVTGEDLRQMAQVLCIMATSCPVNRQRISFSLRQQTPKVHRMACKEKQIYLKPEPAATLNYEF
eukprot:scaffold132528_cov41-Prasinocladus_malaysianus.AAC.1